MVAMLQLAVILIRHYRTNMRTKITVGLHILAMVIGALSLYEGWGRVSQVLLITAAAMIFIKNFISELVFKVLEKVGVPVRAEPIVPGAKTPKVLVGFQYVAITMFVIALLLQWTRGL
jgi:hypothetical protein